MHDHPEYLVSHLADIVSAIRALVKLLMGANGFKGSEAGKALIGDAIAVNTVLKELDISGGANRWEKCDAEFAKGFSPGLGANGALASLDLSQNGVPAEEMGPIERLCESKQIALRK